METLNEDVRIDQIASATEITNNSKTMGLNDAGDVVMFPLELLTRNNIGEIKLTDPTPPIPLLNQNYELIGGGSGQVPSGTYNNLLGAGNVPITIPAAGTNKAIINARAVWTGLYWKARWNEIPVPAVQTKDDLVLSQPVITGYYLANSAGAQTANATFNIKIFTYTGGSVYASFTTTTAGRFIIFYDASMNVIGGISSSAIAASTTFTDFLINNIPINTAFIGISGLAANTLSARANTYALNNDTFQNTKSISVNTVDLAVLKANQNFLAVYSTVIGAYIGNSAGTQQTNATFNTVYFTYLGGDVYLNFTTTAIGRFVIFYDVNMNVVFYISSSVIAANTTYTGWKIPYTIPSNTAYIAVSGLAASPLSAYMPKYALQTDVETLKKSNSSVTPLLNNSQTLTVDSTVNGVYLNSVGVETSTASAVYVRYFKHAGGNPSVNFKSSTINRRIVFLNSSRKILSVFGSDSLFASNTVYENYKLVDIPAETAYIGITCSNDYQAFITEPVYSLRVDTPKKLLLSSDSIGGYFNITSAQIPGLVFLDKHVGGERTIDTLAALNAIPYIADPFTMPSLNTDTVNINIYSKEGFAFTPDGNGGVTWTQGRQVNPALTKPCSIGGIAGVLTCYRDTDPQGRSFVFKRNVSGTAITFDRPVDVYNTDNLRNRNSIVICNMGTNGGYKANDNVPATEADADNLVAQFKKVRDFISPQHNNYIFCGHYILSNQGGWQATKDWFDMYEAKMVKEFGQRFISLRNYLLNRCFKDIGVTPNSTDIASLNQYSVPLTLIPDKTHPSTIVGLAISNHIMERMQWLGMIDYYIPNVLTAA